MSKENEELDKKEAITQAIKFERAEGRVVPQDRTYVSKSDKLGDFNEFLRYFEQVEQNFKGETRQRWQGLKSGRVTGTKDVMKLLNDPLLESVWGVIPLDKLVEWAAAQLDENGTKKYQIFADLRDDYEIVPIGGGGKCRVEIACDPSRQDIIDVFKTEGIEGLRRYIIEKNILVTTDTPGIAGCFFESSLLRVLSGSLEAMEKWYAPIIVGIVQSGDSLKEENWYRLSDTYSEAVLLRSQLVVIINKQKKAAKMAKEFENSWNGSYWSGEKQLSPSKTSKPKEEISINLPPLDATSSPELTKANSGSNRN